MTASKNDPDPPLCTWQWLKLGAIISFFISIGGALLIGLERWMSHPFHSFFTCLMLLLFGLSEVWKKFDEQDAELKALRKKLKALRKTPNVKKSSDAPSE